jgi:uncharacterized membrane protein (GlpM family)
MLIIDLDGVSEGSPLMMIRGIDSPGYTNRPCLKLNGRRCIMQLWVKLIFSLAVILAATGIAKKFPSAAGLIGVMPLTGALVLVWVYLENRGDPLIMQGFTKGALWGILPSMLFFLVAFVGFKREFTLGVVLVSSFAAWIMAAWIHQWLLR